MKKILFFIRNFANYDHLAPIIVELSKTKKINILIVYCDSLYDYNNDPHHILFSKFKNIKIINTVSSLKKNLSFLNITTILTERIYYLIKSEFLFKILHKLQTFQKLNIEKTLKSKIIQSLNEPVLGIFDYSKSDFINSIKDTIYRKKGVCINIPHWVWIWQNKLRCNDMLSFNTDNPYEYGSFDHRDICIVENKKSVEILKELKVSPRKIIFLGSARFSHNWVLKKNELLNEKKIKISNNKSIKILFLCPKIWDNIFWDELIRSINLISNVKNAKLIIQYHPNVKYSSLKKLSQNILDKNNVFISSNDYSTSQLISWSDVVFNINTTVFFEALIKNKLLVNLNHLHINQFYFQNKKYYYETINRDELVEILSDIRKLINKNKKSKDLKDLFNSTIYNKNKNPNKVIANYLLKLSK